MVSISVNSGAQIATDNGDKNIEYIKVGDSVLTHMGRYKRVSHISSKIYRGDLLVFKVADGTPVKCAPQIRFFSIDSDGERIWKKAKDFKAGDYVCLETMVEDTPNGEWLRVKSIERISGACRYLFGLEVEEDESFTLDGYIVSATI